MNEDKRKDLINNLTRILGEEYVAYDPATLDIYSRDMSPMPPSLPDVVVMPESVKEVQEIIKLANRVKVAIVPHVAGTTLGGLTIPNKGGIIVDLKRMNRIIEVDPQSMYAVIEPGVTFTDLQYYLDHNCPELRFGIAYAPSGSSVVANYLLGGMGNLMVKGGDHQKMINGIEAVLPTGDTLRTGSICMSNEWLGRYSIPDFCGLFVNWKGASGIVTKASIQLWPKYAFQDYYGVVIYDIDDFAEVAGNLARADIAEKQDGRSSVTLEIGFNMYKPGVKTLPWEFLFIHTISAPTKVLYDAKVETLEQVVKNLQRKGIKVEISEQFSRSDMVREESDMPTRGHVCNWLDYSRGGRTEPPAGGGGTWVGSYFSLRDYAEGYKSAKKLFEKYGFPPIINSRTISLGRYATMRCIIPFNRHDAEEVKAARALMVDLARDKIEKRTLIYKAPYWAAEMMIEKADPDYVNFLKRMKRFLDPNNIMNPGKLGF